MGVASQGAQWVAGVIWIVCFILILLAMFRNGKGGLAIICLLLSLCFGVGSLVAFVVGWMRSSEWNLRTVMLIMTIALLVGLLGTGGTFVTQ